MSNNREIFPSGGMGWDAIQAEMQVFRADDIDWSSGRTPLFVFYNDDETKRIGQAAYNAFFVENALGRKRAFFSIAKMETDVLDYGLDLFSAPDEAAGVFTSGGSESIFVALKAARDAHRAKTRTGRETQLNMVMPITAHAAFDKAADAMDIEIRRASLRDDLRVDPSAMRALVDEHTMAMVGSAPCFPHGVIDPIKELSDIALDLGVWLHVDACVGGWMAPFFTRIGRSTPDFDFRFAGVRSISADLHKFGFCPKPASTVFFRNTEERDRGMFVADKWPNGRFATNTIAGTRPGGAVAGAWAVLNHLGTGGYLKAARNLAEMTDKYVEGITAIEGFRMWATPDLSIINYGVQGLDIFAVAEAMKRRGWLSGLTNTPKGMHSMMSMKHAVVREEYLSHLSSSADEVRKQTVQSSILAEY
jgi:glutamate/tyrosine decarboxylase-like PLP-dependent enzyme